jgi:protein SCO1/2
MQTDPSLAPVTQPSAPPASVPRRRRRPIFGVLMTAWLALLLLVCWLGWSRLHAYRPFSREVFADPKPAPEFHLTDQNGRPLSLENLRGKVVLLTFGYTHCPNICPMTLANLNQAFTLLTPEQKARVQVVFISVDPKRDTPAQLLGYVPFYNPAFLGASGSAGEIARVARAYGVFYAADAPSNPAKPDTYNVTHSAYLYLIDKRGRWIALYDNQQLFESEKLSADLAYFSKE